MWSTVTERPVQVHVGLRDLSFVISGSSHTALLKLTIEILETLWQML